MFLALAPRASFEDMDSTTGRLFLSCALTAIVTGVSVMPCAIFASVLPVHGATSISSSPMEVPIGSASTMVVIGCLPVRVSISRRKSSALKKRVSKDDTL